MVKSYIKYKYMENGMTAPHTSISNGMGKQ
jgi:hypothetical protein